MQSSSCSVTRLLTAHSTEPNTGLETLKLRTTAKRDGDDYLISGQKMYVTGLIRSELGLIHTSWISSAQVATNMILLARTTPLESVKSPSEGLSLFFIPLDKSQPGLTLQPIKKMGGRAIDANEVFFDSYRIPAASRIGDENAGFRYVLHGLNAERCLLAGEALGLGYAALRRAVDYAKGRVVFSRPIGQNQGVQHPLAESFMQLEAAKLATYHAAGLYDRVKRGELPDVTQKEVGVACNSAKFLAAEAAFKACERAILAHGGMGYAREYHVERYMREIFVPRIAPVSRVSDLAPSSQRMLC
jgi:acyl-CoA dehydrogenase